MSSAASSATAPTSSAPHKRVLTVRELLARPDLAIPQYQRPYKWTEKNVAQLFTDISTHRDKSSYRLGTVVFHSHAERLDIVDGQQRTLTLMLAVRALIALKMAKLERKDLREQLGALGRSMVDPEFANEEARRNLHQNYLAISRIVGRSDFTEELIDCLLNKCAVVCFTLHDVSEAFQFFDSQNARGRDLEPHDLLKAFHLREFDGDDEPLKAATVGRWEACETQELVTLFAEYLYRIRSWAKGDSARYFGKENTPLFKGVNLATTAPYPYVEQLRIAHHWVDHYNKQPERRIDRQAAAFPFHLDQIIINGRRFFEMTDHYRRKISLAHSPETTGAGSLDGFAPKILRTIDEYPGRGRTGDRYVRAIFDCLLIYYIDKFGSVEFSRAIEKAFVWAYRLRLDMEVLQLATMDNYVVENNVFRLIQGATRPEDFLNHSLPVLTENRSTKTEPIVKLLKEMRYYE